MKRFRNQSERWVECIAFLDKFHESLSRQQIIDFTYPIERSYQIKTKGEWDRDKDSWSQGFNKNIKTFIDLGFVKEITGAKSQEDRRYVYTGKPWR